MSEARINLASHQKDFRNLGELMLPDLQLNDHLRLRKQHPCGSYEWTVIRLGADIGLECKGCGRRVMLTRRELAKRLKTNLTKHETEHNEQSADS
jgi:hypothetical protein